MITTSIRSAQILMRVAVLSIAVVLSSAWPGAAADQSAAAAAALDRAKAAADQAKTAAVLADTARAVDGAKIADLQAALATVQATPLPDVRISSWVDVFDQRGQGTGIGSGQGTVVTPRPMQQNLYFGDAYSGSYDAGLNYLDNEQWERAIEAFDRVIKGGKTRVDGAMYWKAYALNKLGKRSEALALLQDMQKAHPGSRWLDDAKALEIEVKQSSGQAVKPEDHSDDDLKLLAMNSLMRSDPERAIPMLQQVLKARNSLKVKERALFVLAQSDSPKARDVVAEVARTASNPDLQLKAIRYLGMFGRSNTQVLADIYAGSKDIDVKREILRSLAAARDYERLITIAKNEPSSELRLEAIRSLGSPFGRLNFAYEVRADNLWVAKGTGRTLVTPAPSPGRAAVAEKAQADRKVITDALIQIYRSDKDPAVKKQVISTLASSDDAASLVALARGESDLAMKREIVARLSTMKSKEATDYMLELLK